MERIPEYCKVGFVTSIATVANGLIFGLLKSYPLAAPVAIGCKVFLIAFPVVGLAITVKKMYEYHKVGRQRIPNHDD